MIILADKNGNVDSSYHTLVKHIPTDIPIVMVSYLDNFVFNDELLSLKPKEFIVVDFIEMGWDYDYSNHTLENYYKRFKGEEWKKYHDWAYNSEPLMCFKRELDKVTAKEQGYCPIDYPATVEPIPIQSKEEFNNRPITAAYYFGRSHEGRLRLHGNIWEGATKYGYSVCDNIYQFNDFMHHERGEKYISLHLPHYSRIDISHLMSINGMAKIGIVPHGAGIKTFRASEVSCNSVMLMWEDNLSWSYEWVHGVNCLKCKQGEELETIRQWQNSDKLYNIYLEGVKTWEKYQTKNYIDNYLMPIINAAK